MYWYDIKWKMSRIYYHCLHRCSWYQQRTFALDFQTKLHHKIYTYNLYGFDLDCRSSSLTLELEQTRAAIWNECDWINETCIFHHPYHSIKKQHQISIPLPKSLFCQRYSSSLNCIMKTHSHDFIADNVHCTILSGTLRRACLITCEYRAAALINPSLVCIFWIRALKVSATLVSQF